VNAASIIRRASLAGLTTLTALAMVAPVGVAAKDGEVIRRGACTNNSVWKIKVAPDNGRLEVEFEVDTPKVGKTWSVKMFQNGTQFFSGTRVTQAPSGSFQVRFLRPNTSGTDTFKGKAVNLSSGETCIGQVSI
jgi:hypothetical protein